MSFSSSKYGTLIIFLAMSAFLAGCGSETSADSQGAKASATDTTSKPAGAAEIPDGLLETLAEKFAAARPDLRVTEVHPTEVEGIYQVIFDGKGAVYSVASGDYFFVGDLYQIDNKRMVNVSEKQANGPRAELIAGIKKEDMIIFSPAGEVKASVVVFTDVDCGYCRKLHEEVPRMNELGIEIKYLAYPRAGIGSESYNKIASAWCADDPRQAITQLKSGKTIPTDVCEGNPVADQFNIGIRAGINGTPALILETGELIPGYLAADKLAQTLGI